MRRLIIIVILFVGLHPVASHAIGGDRRGFTLGIGLGYSPLAYYRHTSGWDATHSGALTTLLIGYGLNSRNSLVLEGTSTNWSAGSTGIHLNSTNLRWYHYYGDHPRSSFISLGAGVISILAIRNAPALDWLIGWDETLVGPGISLGGGYEFFPRGLVNVHLGLGYAKRYLMLHGGVMFTLMGY